MEIYSNLEHALHHQIANLFDNGTRVSSRGSNQIENLFTSMCILDPTDIQISNVARAFNPHYAMTEWLWYLSGDPSVKNIGKFARIWMQIQNDEGEVESNYGSYILGDQWDFVVKELQNDPESRRCTLVVHQPYHKYKNMADMPCTQYLQFFIRENKLHLGVSMRSNDVVFGFCNDVFTFTLFQQLMYNELKAHAKFSDLELGHYYHHAGSMHIYERHWDMGRKIQDLAKIKGYVDVEHDHKYKLKPGVTFEKIKNNEWYLPTADLDKETIDDTVIKIVNEIFE